MENNGNIIYKVLNKEHVCSNVYTVSIQRQDGGRIKYSAGQYINVYFRDTGTPEGKAYTISSAPSENICQLTVKVIGEFSGRIAMLNPGETFEGSLPYGYFFSESEESPLVMMAAGIGITPFRSMIVEALNNGSSRQLYLLHSSKTNDELVFKKLFDELSSKHPNLHVRYFLTRELPNFSEGIGRRMTGRDAVELVGNIDEAEYLICGSISFTRDMWHSLKEAGANEEFIYTEAFFSH